MSEPIVVGIDGSDEAEHALDWAAAEAGLRQRPLHIVHAVENWPYKTPLFAPPETAERFTRAAHMLLAGAREHVQKRWPDLETSTAAVAGETPEALREQSEKACELVLGSRGRGGFASLLLGSTSLRVAEHSPVPVVIVRGDAADRGEIVVGIDPKRDASAILDYAFDAAALRGARVRIVHAWRTYETLIEAGYAIDVEQARQDLRTEAIEAFAPQRDRYPQIDVVEEIVLGHPVTALTNASRNARLLVVGAHDRHWNAPHLGSIGHGVVHHAQCPVAVVHPR
ncbi:universal stress protein [Actinomadura macra]|uniref:universal stress protein n=1 Tax=Actinomadura macra TaxID=46164 RepID=UPI0008346258|nr:universal stress protein [Actinomadura macra]